MNNSSSKLLSTFKYTYLIAFFALLSGFFHPLITNTGFGIVIFGVLILFVGLTGGILLYKSVKSEKKRGVFEGTGGILVYRSFVPITSDKKRTTFLVGGFILITISLYYIFLLTGRI